MPTKELKWRETIKALGTANEKQAKAMLEAECSRMGNARPQWLLRIYGRYSVLRREREVKELLGL